MNPQLTTKQRIALAMAAYGQQVIQKLRERRLDEKKKAS